MDTLKNSALTVPRVSIGLAVYNGERYLAATIEAILDQTFTDFELILSDNDSTDQTASICGLYVERDKRVRYYRNPVNIGGVLNENRTIFLARGEFFKLAAHDDLISANYVASMVAAMDAHPDIEMFVPNVVLIDEDGVRINRDTPIAGNESSVAKRWRALLDFDYGCEATYGLVRLSALRAVRAQANFLHSDRIVLCELATRAPFELQPDAVLFRRLHAGNVFRDWRGRMSWFQPELKLSGHIRLPHWKLLGGYIALLLRIQVSVTQRAQIAVEIGRWAVGSTRSLVADIVYACRMLLSGVERRRARYEGEGR